MNFQNLLEYISENFRCKKNIPHAGDAVQNPSYNLICDKHGVFHTYLDCTIVPGEREMMPMIGEHIDKHHKGMHHMMCPTCRNCGRPVTFIPEPYAENGLWVHTDMKWNKDHHVCELYEVPRACTICGRAIVWVDTAEGSKGGFWAHEKPTDNEDSHSAEWLGEKDDEQVGR